MLRDGPLPDRHQPHLPYLMPSLEESVPSILISCHPSIYGSSILILRHPSIHGPSILILSHRSIHGPYILISRHLSIDDSSILILGCRSIYGPYILISRCRSLFRDVEGSGGYRPVLSSGNKTRPEGEGDDDASLAAAPTLSAPTVGSAGRGRCRRGRGPGKSRVSSGAGI